jgi:preprotein translocase subunit SecB
MAENDTQQNSGESQKQFAIQKIYTRDISFESPNAPEIFTEQLQPEISLDLNSHGKRISDDVYEVILSLTVTVKHQEKTAYLIEVQQSGIFNIRGFEPEELGHMMGSFCPEMLFPYAREAVSDIATRGGFPQLLLAPVNFEALYAQHLAEQQKQGESGGASH